MKFITVKGQKRLKIKQKTQNQKNKHAKTNKRSTQLISLGWKYIRIYHFILNTSCIRNNEQSVGILEKNQQLKFGVFDTYLTGYRQVNVNNP